MRISTPLASAIAALTIASAGLVALVENANATQNMGPMEVAVTAADFSFSVSQITVQAGQPLRIAITNTGERPHNVTITTPAGDQGSENAPPGGSMNWEVTLTDPGTYAFFCSVGNGGHRERGMEGTVEVTAGGAVVSFPAI